MSEADLNRLERDVILARARFAGDLARVRSPDTLSDFKNDLWAKATDVKDELVETAKESATSGVHSAVSDLKGRVSANPAAVLAIGAGLAWHLARHPPIASLLVGLGVWSLWRTTPAPEGEGFLPRAMELATVAQDTVQDWSAQAAEAVTQLTEQTTSTVDKASAVVREAVHDVRGTAAAAADRVAGATRDTVSYVRREAAAAGERTTAILRDHGPDEVARDSLLLGAAAMAVTAAVGIAYQRRH